MIASILGIIILIVIVVTVIYIISTPTTITAPQQVGISEAPPLMTVPPDGAPALPVPTKTPKISTEGPSPAAIAAGTNTAGVGSIAAAISPEVMSEWNGTCSFAKDCPAGWTDKGTIGYIVENGQINNMGFPVGGAFNAGWTWQHPRLCCNESNSSTAPATTLNTESCKSTGSLSGMIVPNSELGKTGLSTGGGFNPDWTWQHYNTCADQSGDYMLAAHCPAGWEDRGTGGVITANQDLSKSPFAAGGALNAGWTWRHPRICKKIPK